MIRLRNRKEEPVELSQETQRNLWRVMLEHAQERGHVQLPRNYYRRWFPVILIPIAFGIVLAALVVAQ